MTSREMVMDEARENVRAALNAHRQTLLDARAETKSSDEREHLLVSLTQVESAKRVLWMDY